MALKHGTCTACEKHIEFQTIHTGSAIAYKCSNCWAILSAGDMGRVDKLTAQLLELDQARAEGIRGFLDPQSAGKYCTFTIGENLCHYSNAPIRSQRMPSTRTCGPERNSSS